MKKLPIILLSVLALSTVACRPMALQLVEPEGPAEYKLGWEDGCDTGLSADSAYFYKAIYGFKKRPEMGANNLYKQGWNEGFSYCRFSSGALDSANGSWGKGLFGLPN